MPPDDDPLPAFAPQWLRSGQTNKAALGAGAGSVAQAKGGVGPCQAILHTLRLSFYSCALKRSLVAA